MRLLPVSVVLVLSTIGCADLLGFGDGGAGGATGEGGTTAAGGMTGGAGGMTGGAGGMTGGAGGATCGGGAGGAMTGGGGAGGTIPTECAPGAVEACFEGPPEIDGVGACKAGSRACQGDGTWGPCTGQVKPAVELCASPADESCDGVAGCTGGHGWSRRFGTTSGDGAQGVTVDLAGNTIVVGESSGKLDLGQPMPENLGQNDLYVVKLDPAGDVLWGKTFGSANQDRARAVAADAEGNIYVAGQAGPLNIPGFAGQSSQNAFVLKLSPGGDVLWVRSTTGPGLHTIADIAAAPGGGVVVVGSYTFSPLFGGAPVLPGTTDKLNTFVASVFADGTVGWVKGYGDDLQDQTGASIAVDGAGVVVVTVDLTGTIQLGGPPLASVGARDIAIAALDGNAQGAHLWSERYGDAANQQAPLVRASAADGTFVLAAPLVGQIDVGGGPLVCTQTVGGVPMPCAAGDVDIAVWKWKLSAGTMNLLWQKHVPVTGTQLPTGLAVDPEGYTLISGIFKTQLDWSGGAAPLLPPATGARFAAKLGPGGGFVWQRGFASPVDLETGPALRAAADPATGRAVLAGGFQGSTDFGGGVLQSVGGGDIAVVSLLP